MANLTQDRLEQLKERLLARQRVLTEEVKEQRARTATDANEESIGAVGDTGDESVMRMITDLGLQEAGRDLEELHGIDAALRRIDDGSYGTCEMCAGEIDSRRLEAQPTATRCIACQAQHEKTYAHKGMPTL